VDVHPAKRGWSATGSASPDSLIIVPNCTKFAQLQMFSEWMCDQVYLNAFKYIAQNYFTKSNYYKAPTKLANGSTADCCFFSFYIPSAIGKGVASNATSVGAVALMEEFRKEAEAVAQCLHLNHMTGRAPVEIEARKVASVTDYGWMKLGHPKSYTFPEDPYEVVRDHALAQIQTRTTISTPIT